MKQEEMFITAAHLLIFSLVKHCALCRERGGVVLTFFLLKHPLLVHRANQQSTVHANHAQ